MAMVSQDKFIRTTLIKPQRFGCNKDCSWNVLLTEITKKYSEKPPGDPEDSAVKLADLCTGIALMLEQLNRNGTTWD